MSKNKNKHRVIFFTGTDTTDIVNKPEIKSKLTRNFATQHTIEYQNIMRELANHYENIKPNSIHNMIASTGFTVITTSIDGLQEIAGSTNVIAVHGKLPTKDKVESYLENIKSSELILYGDNTPKYGQAIELVRNLKYGDSYLIVIGDSLTSGLGNILRIIANKRLVNIIEINDDIQQKLAKTCEELHVAGLY